jgi:uncharacterized membrane protein YqjE
MENRIANASVGRLLSGIVSDAEDLVQQQFALFKEEVKEEARGAKQALIPLLAGAVVLFVGAIVLSLTFVHILDEATTLPLWACYAIVAAVLCIGGGIAVAVGLERFREVPPVAEKSVEELKENVRWLTKPN